MVSLARKNLRQEEQGPVRLQVRQNRKILVGAHMERKKSAAAKVVKIAKNVKNQSALTTKLSFAKLVVRLFTTEASQMQKELERYLQ